MCCAPRSSGGRRALAERLALGQERRQDRLARTSLTLMVLSNSALASMAVAKLRSASTCSAAKPRLRVRGQHLEAVRRDRVEPLDHVGDAAGVLVLVQQTAEQQRQRDDADLRDVGATIDRGLPVDQPEAQRAALSSSAPGRIRGVRSRSRTRSRQRSAARRTSASDARGRGHRGSPAAPIRAARRPRRGAAEASRWRRRIRAESGGVRRWPAGPTTGRLTRGRWRQRFVRGLGETTDALEARERRVLERRELSRPAGATLPRTRRRHPAIRGRSPDRGAGFPAPVV